MKTKHSKVLRKALAFVLGAWGIALGGLGLLASFPQLGSLTSLFPWELGKSLASPLFYEEVIAISPQKEDFLTEMVLNRWGYLRQPPQEDSPPVLVSPLPQILEVEPQEEAQPEELPTEIPLEEGNWQIHTMTGSSSQLNYEDWYVINSGKVLLQEEDLPVLAASVSPLSQGDSPQILIYHSHGTESYSQTAGYTYLESDPFRTQNMDYNVCAVGEAMAEVFTEAGYTVLHDKSLHDYPDYNSSYSNSSAMVQQYLALYPDLALIIDLHRDALTTVEGVPYQLLSQDLLETRGESVAQVMMVIGTDGGGYEHSQWRDNFSLALRIQEGLLAYGDFARPITLRTSRYNQQLSTAMILLEVGGHGNTFPQAMSAGILFAESVVETLGED